MSSIPTVASMRTIVSGLNAFWFSTPDCATLVSWVTGLSGLASKRTVTCVGAVTCPGRTSANSSRRLWGFWTMPTTRRGVPCMFQVSPTARWNAEATPWVTATWSGPLG